MSAFYNEVDPYAADWLRNLATAGHIAPGPVDTRSIVDLRPADVAGHTQCHFFAGIAGWSLALRLAGVPDDFPVWTGSCPCQPFSAAGQRKGFADERHLWPAWFDLIRQCRPAIVFGEQVEAAVRLGWLDAVFADLEAEGYACAATVLGAHSVGAPHIRQRLWFVAYAGSVGRIGRPHTSGPAAEDAAERRESLSDAQCRGDAGILGNAERFGVRGEGRRPNDGSARGVPDQDGQRQRLRADFGAAGSPGGMGNAHGFGEAPLGGVSAGSFAHSERSPWAASDWLPCRDGKSRPTQPGLQPLAHGVPGRVGRLRAYGNAIVPQVAASFIAACLDSLPQLGEAA